MSFVISFKINITSTLTENGNFSSVLSFLWHPPFGLYITPDSVAPFFGRFRSYKSNFEFQRFADNRDDFITVKNCSE